MIAYLEAENAHTNAVMGDTAQLQEALFNEMRSRIKETDTSAPVQIDHYFYYERTEAGKQYKIYCRKHNSMDSAEEILLDLNQLAQGHDYLRMANFAVSPDHRYLAYAIDTDGSEVYTLRIKDLESGSLLPDTIPNTYYGLEWGNDNYTLYYTTLDHAKRPDKLWCHVRERIRRWTRCSYRRMTRSTNSCSTSRRADAISLSPCTVTLRAKFTTSTPINPTLPQVIEPRRPTTRIQRGAPRRRRRR
ncbi:MAG: hypothetical protein R2856_17485 [Caldilineaceae bacterium]